MGGGSKVWELPGGWVDDTNHTCLTVLAGPTLKQTWVAVIVDGD